MSEANNDLSDAARQLVAIEELLGGQFIPAGQNPLPEMKVSASVAGGPGALSGLSPEEKARALEAMDVSEVRTCTLCALAAGRTQTVFGEGSPDADLVFVGEGPGQEEDRTGRPFVGRAGELLAKMIGAMGLAREDVFICNVIKCRPPGNRSPAPEEAQACWSYLVRQLEIIRPAVIVTMGNPATKALLNTRLGITKLRGQWQQLPDIGEGLVGTPVMPTFHPAYLLRSYTRDNRAKVWSDLQAVMGRLGMDVPKKS